MTFEQWIYGTNFDNPSINGQWGLLHIITLIICIGLIVALSLIFRKKDENTKRKVLIIIASILIFFELARRIVNITNPITFTKYNILWVLLPRPGCAISVWLIMLAPFINKKWFYNFASIISILCAVIFFAYPGAGFLNKYILFENLYSIVTHSLFFIGSILIVTFKLAKFNYRDMKNELICLGGLVVYCVLEMFVLTKNAAGDPLETDPFYIRPSYTLPSGSKYVNEVADIVGIKSYPLFLVLYLLFIALYFSSFYFFSRKSVNKKTELID